MESEDLIYRECAKPNCPMVIVGISEPFVMDEMSRHYEMDPAHIEWLRQQLKLAAQLIRELDL